MYKNGHTLGMVKKKKKKNLYCRHDLIYRFLRPLVSCVRKYVEPYCKNVRC